MTDVKHLSLLRMGAALVLLAAFASIASGGVDDGWPVWLRIVTAVGFAVLGITGGIMIIVQSTRIQRADNSRGASPLHSPSAR